MPDNSILEVFILGVTLLILGLILFRGHGVARLRYLNFIWLCKFKQSSKNTCDNKKKEALATIINYCNGLNSKWLLDESDLDFSNNTYQLVKKIACAYHPHSKAPMEEARIRCLLGAFMELRNQLLALITFRGVQTITRFRIRHVLILSRAWKTKDSGKQWKIASFFNNHEIYPLFRWFFSITRFLDLTFWATKRISYILKDIVLKILLMRWYLVIGELAIQVYSDNKKTSEIQIESILGGLCAIPELDNQSKNNLPNKIKKISEDSRDQILYHTWSVEWIKVKEIYINLIKNIAKEYHPNSEIPIYEAKLSELLAVGLHLSEKISAIQTYPFVNKILDLRVSHAIVTKDAVDFLSNNQMLSWIKKYKLGYIFKYSLLLFKVIQKKHPGLIFRDFGVILVGEGCKRWFYQYLHDEITKEANTLYQANPSPEI